MQKDNLFIKSGVDFKNLSTIIVEERPLTEEEKSQVPQGPVSYQDVETGKEYAYYVKNKFTVKVTKHVVTQDIQPDEELEKHIALCYKDFDKKMKVVITLNDCDIDCRFTNVRTKETAAGNFACDLIREVYASDISFMNSGNFRGDTLYPNGEMNIGDWHSIFPFKIGILKLVITGAQLLEVLENGVCKYPALEGRFLQVSGMNFSFDASKPAGERVLEGVTVHGLPLDLNKEYTMSAPDYICQGKDGFDVLKELPRLIDEENCQYLKKMIMEFMQIFKYSENREEFTRITEMKEHIDHSKVLKSAMKKTHKAFLKLKLLNNATEAIVENAQEQKKKMMRKQSSIISEEMMKHLIESDDHIDISSVCLRR